MLIEKENLKIRYLKEADQHLLVKWLSDSAVLEFYEGRDIPFDLEKVIKEFYGPEDDVKKCIAEFKGTPIGYIQYYQVTPETSTLNYYDGKETIYGIDQFIGEPAYWNKGIGTLLVRSMVGFLKKQRAADRVIMDPQVTNDRALRCYEKCGFKKVKLLSKHEFHEGEYRDCLLMVYTK